MDRFLISAQTGDFFCKVDFAISNLISVILARVYEISLSVSLVPPAPKNKGSGESLYIEVWHCQNTGGTNQIAAVAQS